MSFWRRVVLGLTVGALAGLLGVVALYPSRSLVRLEMDREIPSFTSGLYDGERDGDVTFAWTAGRAVVRLAGLSRGVNWTCEARVRAARPPDAPPATVVLGVDTVSASMPLRDAEFATVRLDVPARRDRDGLTLSLTSAPVFVPGGGDTRVLGVQADWIQCAPAASWLLPPGSAMVAGAGAAAVFGVAAAISSLAPGAIVFLALFVAAGFSTLIVTGFGAFGAYPERLLWIAAAAALLPLALVTLAAGLRTVIFARTGRREPTGAAMSGAWPLLLAGSLFALELGALAHPGKLLIDAVFQAHRLEWVMSGRYFFTQPLPDGVAFPYAIGLYVVASPLAAFVTDHVFLVRLVAVFAQACAAVALYWWVWRERAQLAAATTALVFTYTAPLVFVVTGNANLPNVFAQAVGTVAIVGAAWLWQTRRRVSGPIIVGLLIALACLSHVTTLAIVTGTILAIGVTMAAAGGPEGRRAALGLAVSLAAALLVSWLLYYQHFPEVYARAATRVAATNPSPVESGAAADDRPAVLVRQLTWGEKAVDALRQVVSDVGWPLLGLAILGSWIVLQTRPPDRFQWQVAAWGGAWTVLLVGATLTKVDTAYQRYAAEFIGRINLAGYPVAAVLGALAVGAAAERRAAPAIRWLVAALSLAALGTAVGNWSAWFR